MANRFLEQARQGRNEFWRYLLTIIAVILVSLSVQLYTVVFGMAIEGTADINEFSPLVLFIVTMAPFPFALLTLVGGLLVLHKRPIYSILNPSGKIAWSRIFLSGFLWFCLSALSDLVLALIDPANYSWTFDLKEFLPYFLLGLVLIPIQTSTEEFIFRGYLTQWMGRYSRSLWLPLIVPSVVFMLLHSFNPEVGAYGMLLTMPLYLGIGLLLGWLTLRSESLELALGLHAANNLYAGLMVTFPNSALSTPAMVTLSSYQPEIGLIVFVAVTVLYVGVLFLIKRDWLFPEHSKEASPGLTG